MSDKPQAGRELDAEIAEKIMGWSQQYIQDYDIKLRRYGGKWTPMANAPEFLYHPSDHFDPRRVPSYSTDIAAAWDVVDLLLEYAFSFKLYWVGAVKVWCCQFSDESPAFARTASLAICLAALETVKETNYGLDE